MRTHGRRVRRVGRTEFVCADECAQYKWATCERADGRAGGRTGNKRKGIASGWKGERTDEKTNGRADGWK